MYPSLQSHLHMYRFIYPSIIISLIKLHLNWWCWWWTENIVVVSSPSSIPNSCSNDIYTKVDLRNHLKLGRSVETEVCTRCEKEVFLYWGFQHSQILNIWRDLGNNSPCICRMNTISPLIPRGLWDRGPWCSMMVAPRLWDSGCSSRSGGGKSPTPLLSAWSPKSQEAACLRGHLHLYNASQSAVLCNA